MSESVGISIDPIRVIGEKQIRLEAMTNHAQQLEEQLAEAKANIQKMADVTAEQYAQAQWLIAELKHQQEEK